jgi:hypothetical protein
VSPVREREFEPEVWVASLFEVRSIVINGLAYPDIPGRSLRSGSWLSARTCGLLPSLLRWTTEFEVTCLGPRPAGHLGYRVAVTYCNPSWWACLQMPNHALPAGPAVHKFIRRSHRRQRTRARHNLLIERITVQRLRVDVGPRPGDLQIFVAQLIHIVE